MGERTVRYDSKMDSGKDFDSLVNFVFQYFDQQKRGSVLASQLPAMLRSLGQVWSFSECLDLQKKYGDMRITFPVFKQLAMEKRKKEQKAMSKKSAASGGRSIEGLSGAEVDELALCFALFDPDNTKTIAVNELQQVLTCLGQSLSHRDFQQLLALEKLEQREYLVFKDFCRLFARI